MNGCIIYQTRKRKLSTEAEGSIAGLLMPYPIMVIAKVSLVFDILGMLSIYL
jgi:hypothetical protein